MARTKLKPAEIAKRKRKGAYHDGRLPLSAKRVQRLKGEGRYHDALVPGLYLQITASGARSWLLRFELNGKERMMGLWAARRSSRSPKHSQPPANAVEAISSVRVTPLVRATHSAAAASGTIISNRQSSATASCRSPRLSSATVLSPASSRGQEHDCQRGAVSMPKPTAHLGRNRCFVAGR